MTQLTQTMRSPRCLQSTKKPNTGLQIDSSTTSFTLPHNISQNGIPNSKEIPFIYTQEGTNSSTRNPGISRDKKLGTRLHSKNNLQPSGGPYNSSPNAATTETPQTVSVTDATLSQPHTSKTSI